MFSVVLMSTVLTAADCTECGASDISSLAMLCPECGQNMHQNKMFAPNSEKESSLIVKLFYTGNRPDRVPEYGKVFINGVYRGNIYKLPNPIQSGTEGRFKNTATDSSLVCYEKKIDKIQSGVLKVEVEMRFDRMYGALKSYKKVEFPYVLFENGRETLLEHEFNAAATFSDYNPPKLRSLAPFSEMKVRGASGTVALNIPLF